LSEDFKKIIDELVISRCNDALQENKEFMEAEQSGKVDADTLMCMAICICYKQAIRDNEMFKNYILV